MCGDMCGLSSSWLQLGSRKHGGAMQIERAVFCLIVEESDSLARVG